MTRLFSRRWWLTVLALVFAGAASSASAAFTAYTGATAYGGATQNLTTVTIPDPTSGSTAYLGAGTASVSYQGVTFATSAAIGNGYFFLIGKGYSGVPAVLSSQGQTTGLANFRITFASAVTAFSLNYGTATGSNVLIQLSNGDQVTEASTGAGYSTPNFLGATDTTAFTSVLITTTDTTLNINTITYGTAVAVPEPGSLILCGVGGIGALAFGRARRSGARPA